MRAHRRRWTTGACATALAALLMAGTAAFTPLRPPRDAALHLELERSEPAADATLDESPAEIRLWFTQSPQIDGTSVRVLPVGGEPLDTGDARLAEGDDQLVLASLTAPLANGRYQVRWRAMARDGHVVRGTFEFRVDIAR